MRQRALLFAAAGLMVAAACSEMATPTVVQPTVQVPVNRGNLGVSPSTALFVPGQSETYVALPEQNFTRNLAAVTWWVDDPRVASVTPDGRVTAHAAGFTWLRAEGPDGRAAHPISVALDSPRQVSGGAQLESCSSAAVMTCSAIMKGAGVATEANMRYRVTQGMVVAEFWYDNDRNTSALVGSEIASGQFRFDEPALLAPVVSLGAGGCCSALSEFTASADSTRLTGGAFKTSSSSSTVRYRIVSQ